MTLPNINSKDHNSAAQDHKNDDFQTKNCIYVEKRLTVNSVCSNAVCSEIFVNKSQPLFSHLELNFLIFINVLLST